jgi:predicted DNA-binding protein YlxM (UPF0122 family)
MNIERTLPINGFENTYTISSTGQVFSIVSNMYLKCSICSSGYPMAKLFKSYDSLTNKRDYKHIRVHRLVMEHFGINPNNLPCVNHKDGNKLNSAHAFNTGLTPKKKRLLSDEQLQECKNLYKLGKPIKELMHTYGVSRTAIEKYILNSIDMSAAKKIQLTLRAQVVKEKISIPVHQYSLDGVYIKSWESMITAAKTLGISNVTVNRSKSAGGFIWRKLLI